MKKLLTIIAAFGLSGAAAITAQASPQQDLTEFRAYFADRFPDIPFKEFIIMLDGGTERDSAGIAKEISEHTSAKISVVHLPDKMDPDEMRDDLDTFMSDRERIV